MIAEANSSCTKQLVALEFQLQFRDSLDFDRLGVWEQWKVSLTNQGPLVQQFGKKPYVEPYI